MAMKEAYVEETLKEKETITHQGTVMKYSRTSSKHGTPPLHS
jgi:hypothetical protein